MATNAISDNFLDPSSGRQRIASGEDMSTEDLMINHISTDITDITDIDDDDDDDIQHEMHQLAGSVGSRKSIAPNEKYKMNCKERTIWYLNIAIEGDLAGFQIAWLFMSFGFIILKAFGITDTIDRIEWWAIFIIPLFNALLTAWFDYIIRQFRSTHTVESLKKSRFVILWLIKLIKSLIW